MVKIEYSIDIQVSEQTVWDFLSNLDNIPSWYTKMVGYSQLSDGEPGVGTMFRLDWTVTDHAEPCECNILEWDPPSLISFHVSNIGMENQWRGREHSRGSARIDRNGSFQSI